jgi:hypothetical protein
VPHRCLAGQINRPGVDAQRAVDLLERRVFDRPERKDAGERGIADGDVPAGANAATIAAFYNAVNQGMAIQARDGADRSKLSTVAESAISAWDGLVGAG